MSYSQHVALRINRMQLIGSFTRLAQLVGHNPRHSNTLESFILEVPRARYILSPHRVRFKRITTLYGDSLLYDVYTPMTPAVDFPFNRLVSYLVDAHVVEPISVASHRQ